MKTQIKVAAGLLAIIPQASFGGGRVVSYCNSGYCAPSYSAYVAPTYVQPIAQDKVTVVNNLIGIPVPVPYTQPIAQQGSTVYGYSTVAQSYGAVDMAQLYNQAGRLTAQAQQLSGQATTDFSALISQEGNNRARVAEIIAKGQAAAQTLQAVSSGNTTQNSTQSLQLRVVSQGGRLNVITENDPTVTEAPATPATPVPPDPRPDPQPNVPGGGNTSALVNVIQNKCTVCHSTANAKGGLDMTKYFQLDQAVKAKILARITHIDPAKRMPIKSDGTPGQSLSTAEMKLFFCSQ